LSALQLQRVRRAPWRAPAGRNDSPARSGTPIQRPTRTRPRAAERL